MRYIFLFLFIASMFLPTVSLAQGNAPRPIFTSSAKPTIDVLPDLINLSGQRFDSPQQIFSFVVRTLALIAGIAAFFAFLYGGYKYITSGGDPAAADQGKKILVAAIVGMFIVALSSVVIQFIIQVLRNAL